MTRPDIYFKATALLQCGKFKCRDFVETEAVICLTQETEIDTVPLYSLNIASFDSYEIPEGWSKKGDEFFCPTHGVGYPK